jgi:bifunctional enzyme CysN/CysC
MPTRSYPPSTAFASDVPVLQDGTRVERQRMRGDHPRVDIPYFEIYVNTPLSECERPDPNGLQASAALAGVDDPFEPPLGPELELTPGLGPPSILSGQILDLMGDIGGPRR